MATNPDVGTIFEVGINGAGYMLANDIDGKNQYQRQITTLQPQRINQQGNYFNESTDRYVPMASVDYSGGAGTKYRSRDGVDASTYWQSEGIDPFSVEGQFTLLPDTVAQVSNAPISGNHECLAVYSSGLLARYDATRVVLYGTVGGAGTVCTITGAITPGVKSIVSDGYYAYVLDDENSVINRGSFTTFTSWSTVTNVEQCWYAVDRIWVHRNVGGIPIVTDLDVAGADAGANRFQFRPNSWIDSVTAGDGWVFMANSLGNQSTIYSWQLGSSTNALTTALVLPAGMIASKIAFYQGNVFVFAHNYSDTTSSLFRCATSNGRLVATSVLKGIGGTIGAFAFKDDLCLFAWKGMTSTGQSGVGAVSLVTGGWCKWLAAPYGSTTFTGDVDAICLFGSGTPGDQIVMTGFGLNKLVYSSPTALVTVGWLETSDFDLGSAASKALDRVDVSHGIIPALPVSGTGCGVVSWYILNGSSTQVSVGSGTTPGATKVTGVFTNVVADSVRFRIDLYSNSSDHTVSVPVKTIIGSSHLVGIKDRTMILPINCSDNVVGLNGARIWTAGSDTGSVRASALEALVGGVIELQDIDWKTTGTTSFWEVSAVQVDAHDLVKNRNKGRLVHSLIATLQLRQRYSG